MSGRSYILVAAGAWFGLVLACVALSVFVDPYRLFGTKPIAGLTALKPRIYQQSGIAKTYQLERIKPRTLLLGNSRVQNGFDPRSAAIPANWQPVFNAGMAGKDLFTSLRLLQEANAVAPVQTVILCVDFTDFLKTATAPGALPPMSDDEMRLLVDRDGKPNPERDAQLWRDRYAATLTISALYDDFVTLADQRPRSSVTMYPNGYNPLHEYGFYVRQTGYYGLFSQKTAAYRVQFQKYPHPDFHHPMRLANFRYLVEIIHIARAHHERLILFIPPYHAQFLDIVRATGFWNDFDEWKNVLAGIVTSESAGTVELADFSGYNAFTTESVPPKHDLHHQMRWYWEAGHYKAALGDIMLKRLISGSGAFGKTLTPSLTRNGEDGTLMARHANARSKAPAAAN